MPPGNERAESWSSCRHKLWIPSPLTFLPHQWMLCVNLIIRNKLLAGLYDIPCVRSASFITKRSRLFGYPRTKCPHVPKLFASCQMWKRKVNDTFKIKARFFMRRKEEVRPCSSVMTCPRFDSNFAYDCVVESARMGTSRPWRAGRGFEWTTRRTLVCPFLPHYVLHCQNRTSS